MQQQTSFAWNGPPPRGSLAAALEDAGLLGPAHPPPPAPATVVRAPRPPQPPPAPPWIWVTERPVPRAAALDAVRAGAYDVIALSDPDAPARLVRRLRETLVAEPNPLSSPVFVGESEASRRLLAQIARAAATAMPVLLTGETGTGKEVCARLLHAASARRESAFIPIDCAAIPNELMEAELFGYARGAFSGAVQRYDGQLAAAEGGTVFLDEVDDTPISTQAKLLRVLEDRTVSRLGENVWRTVDFRLVAATNRELPALVDAGAFLPDLYQRLAIVAITLPPLRERRADLPALVAHFIERFYADEPGAARAARVRSVTPEALEALAAYPWPGNIRELRNVLFQALVYKRAGEELLLSDLPARVLAPAPARGRALVDRAELARRLDGGILDLRAEVEALERAAVEEALARAAGNAAAAAALLGRLGRGRARVPGSTLRAMMRRLGLAGAVSGSRTGARPARRRARR